MKLTRIYAVVVFLFACFFTHWTEPFFLRGTTVATPAAYVRKEAPMEQKQVLLPVPYLSQLPDYPTGCESVSAVMVLRYYGYDISPKTFIDRYLLCADPPLETANGWTSRDPNQYFLGDPSSPFGWGCFPPVIANAVEAFAPGELTAKSLTGVSPQQLCRDYIDNHIPVLLWATADMKQPEEEKQITIIGTGKKYTWRAPMHCLLLVGYTKETYLFHDPLVNGVTAYDKDEVAQAYESQGKQALAILRK